MPGTLNIYVIFGSPAHIATQLTWAQREGLKQIRYKKETANSLWGCREWAEMGILQNRGVFHFL